MSQMWEAERKENAVQIHILGLFVFIIYYWKYTKTLKTYLQFTLLFQETNKGNKSNV